MKIKLFGGPWDGDIAEVDTNDGFDPPRTYQIECVLREPGGLSVKKGATRDPLAVRRIDICTYVLKAFYRAGRAPEYEYHYQE